MPKYDHGVKAIALATMIIDHYGMIFAHTDDAYRIVGRVAFPLFAYLVAEGVHRTQDAHQYLSRLFVLFVVSQTPYSLFVGYTLNVFLPLAVGALSVILLSQGRKATAVAFLVAYEGFAIRHEISYGFVGPVLVTVFATLRGRLVLSTLVAMALFALDAALTGSRFSRMAVFVMPVVPFVIRFVHWPSRSRWRWAYWVYPAHLAVFFAIAWSMGLIEQMQR